MSKRRQLLKIGSALTAVGLLVACARSEPPVKTQPSNAPTAAAPESATTRNVESATASTGAGTETEQSEAVSGSTTGTGTDTSATNGSASAQNAPARTPDVVFVPTPQPVVDRMLALVAPKKGEIVYDLGCGDGRIVVTAAKKYGVKAFGFDIDPERVAEARENVRKNGVEDLVTIEQKDIFELDLSPANIVTLYLLPRLNVKLIPQLKKLKPGSRIVSHDFDMQGVNPLKHLTITPPGGSREHEIYFWKAPIKVDEAAAAAAAE